MCTLFSDRLCVKIHFTILQTHYFQVYYSFLCISYTVPCDVPEDARVARHLDGCVRGEAGSPPLSDGEPPGDIRTIYCVPCGPLTYIDHQSEDSDSQSDDVNSNIKEDEYSKVLFVWSSLQLISHP